MVVVLVGGSTETLNVMASLALCLASSPVMRDTCCAIVLADAASYSLQYEAHSWRK